MAGKLAILFALVLCLIAVADARGTLRVDNIVAVEDPVVIDALINDEAEIANTVAADNLGFGNFDTLRLNAPFIDVSASFVDITSTGDFVSQSTAGNIAVAARQNVDVNGNRINFTSRQGDVRLSSDSGELSVIAGQQINASASTIDVDASAGGIAILSEGHDVTFDADNSLFLLSDEATGVINVEASDDLTATATTQAFLVAGGAVDMDSRSKTIFDATENLNVVSSFGDIVANAGDEVHVTAGDSFSISAISTSISSNTDGVDINGFEGVEIDSSNGRMTLSGLAQGVSFTALDGQVGLTSSDSSIDFSAVGAGDHAAVYVRGDFSSTVTGQFSTDAQLDTQVYGNTISASLGSTSFDANNDITVFGHNDVDLRSDADLVIDADEVRLLATDIADGRTTFSANAEDINFSGDEVFIFGGEFDMRAGNGDFILNSNDISISALGGDSRSHEISLSGEDVNFTGGDAVVAGGRVHFTGGEQIEMEIGGDAVFNTRQLGGEDSLSIQSGANIGIVSSDGDFSLTDVFGSLEWRFATNPQVPTDASVSITAGNLDITAGEESFRNDVEFNVIAKEELSFSSTGGNTASDVEFEALQVIFTSTETANFGSETGVSLDSDNDIYFDADNIIVNGNSGNGDTTDFNVGNHLYVVTERNPTTTDSITFSASGSTNLDAGNLIASSSGPVTFSGDISNTIISDDTLTFSSGNGNPITFDVAKFTAVIEDAFILTGLHVTFDAAMDISVSTGDDADFISTKLGFDVDTLSGDLSVTSDGDLDISSENNSIVTSTVNPNGPGGDMSLSAEDDIQVTSSDDTTIVSRSGSVSYASTGSSITFNGAADISFSSGTHDDDVFIINAAGSLTFDSDRTVDISGDGPLSVDAGGDYAITGADVDFISNGPVTFNGEEQVAVTSAGTFDLNGGEIVIEATATDVTFNGGIISIDNEESGIAHEEFLGVVDDLVYTAGGRVVVNAGDASYESADFAFTTVDGGRILLSGDNVRLDSVSDNQDASFTTEAAINFEAETDISYYAAGDLTFDAVEFITISAADVSVVVESDLTIDAQAGQLLVENTGDRIEFVVEENSNDADPVRVTSNLEFRADDELQLFARTGEISFTSSGSSQLRANLDGGRNTQGARQKFTATGNLGSVLDGGVPNYVNQAVGFSVNTRHTEGNIIFQTLQGPIIVDSELDQEYITNGAVEIEVTDAGANFDAENTLIEALDGSFFAFSPRDELTIDVTDDLDFLASGSMEILSDQLIDVETGNIEITAFGGDMRFETFLQNDIALVAEDLTFTSGAKGQTFVAQGDITSTSGSDTAIAGARGVSVTTNAGPIRALSASTGNFFDAEEEIRISSGSDLLLENGNAGEAVRFNGVGVVLSATQGNVELNAENDVLLEAGTVVLQSLGTSTTSRDRVLIDSNANLVTFTGTNAFFDATELVSIGKTTTPEVTITALADIDINSSGNVDIVSGDAIVFASTDTFRSQSDNLLSLSAFNAFDITGETSVNLEAIRGSMNLVAAADLTLDAEDIRLTSKGSTGIVMTGSDPMTFTITDGLEFNSQGTIDVQIGGDAVYTSGANIVIESDTRNGDHDLTFESDEGQTFNIVNAVDFSAESSLLINTDSATLVSLDFSASTSRDGDLVLNVGGDFSLTSPDVTATAAIVDLKTNAGDASSGITFTSTGQLLMTSGPSPSLPNTVRDGHFVLSSTDDDVTVSAAAGLNLVTDELFNIEAEDVDLMAGTDLIINTDFLFASHGDSQFGGGAIEFDIAGTTSLSAPMGVITFQSVDGLLSIAPGATSALLTSADDFSIFSVADREGSISIEHSAGPFNLDVPESIRFQGGDAEGPGDVHIEVAAAFTATGNFVNFGSSTINDVAPVSVSAGDDITIVAADQAQFIADSGGIFVTLEDDTGAIDMSASGFDFDATNNINIQSVLAGIELLSSDSITFSAPSLNITSQGIESGIFLHAREQNIIVDSELLSIRGDEAISFNSLFGDFTASSESNLNFLTGGPGGEDGAGFKISHSDSSVPLEVDASLTFMNTRDNVRLLASDSFRVTAGAQAIFTGDTCRINAQGFPQSDTLNSDVSLLLSATQMLVNTPQGEQVFDAGSALTFTTLGDAVMSTRTAPIVFRSDGDVEFEYRGTGAFIAANQLLLVSENNGIEFNAPDQDSLLIGANTLDVFSGIDEQVNAINFEQTSDASISASTSFTIDSSNNALFQGNQAMLVQSSNDLNLLARKGSQLFRSVTLDTMTGFQPGPFEMQTNANEDILMAAHYFIRHRGHNRLSFFDAATALSHNTQSAPQQTTSPNLANVVTVDTACRCTGQNGVNCSSVACPDTYNKVRDMQIALVEVGLLRMV